MNPKRAKHVWQRAKNRVFGPKISVFYPNFPWRNWGVPPFSEKNLLSSIRRLPWGGLKENYFLVMSPFDEYWPLQKYSFLWTVAVAWCESSFCTPLSLAPWQHFVSYFIQQVAWSNLATTLCPRRPLMKVGYLEKSQTQTKQGSTWYFLNVRFYHIASLCQILHVLSVTKAPHQTRIQR